MENKEHREEDYSVDDIMQEFRKPENEETLTEQAEEEEP